MHQKRGIQSNVKLRNSSLKLVKRYNQDNSIKIAEVVSLDNSYSELIKLFYTLELDKLLSINDWSKKFSRNS